MYFRYSSLLIFILFSSFPMRAQTILGVGDLALLAIHSGGQAGAWLDDGLAFVNLIPLDSGTTVAITDNAFLGQTFCANEQTVHWTYHGSQPLPEGTVVEIDGTQATVGVLNRPETLALSTQGDQIHLYQEERLITALSNQTWLATCATSCTGQTSQSCLAPLLGSFALNLNAEGQARENALYIGPDTVTADSIFQVLYDLKHWQQADTALPKTLPNQLHITYPNVGEATVQTIAADSNRLSLDVDANASADPVLIAYASAQNFSRPSGALRRGDALGSSAQVHYAGPVDSVPALWGLNPGERYYIKIWSFSPQYEYSIGKVYEIRTSPHLRPGDLLFSGYCSRADDAFALYLFKDLPAGTRLFFTDEEWNGSHFGTGEGDLIWQLDTALSAGEELIFYGDSLGAWHVTQGSLQVGSSGAPNLAGSNEVLYCYWGQERQPQVFLASIANTFYDDGSRVGSIVNTGLAVGEQALFTASHEDIFRFKGLSQPLPLELLRDSLQDMNRWGKENGVLTEQNGQFPDLPFHADASDILTLTFNGSWNYPPLIFANPYQPVHIQGDTLRWSALLEASSLSVDTGAVMILSDSGRIRINTVLENDGQIWIHSPAEIQTTQVNTLLKGIGTVTLYQYYQAQDHRRYSFYSSMLQNQNADRLFPLSNPADFYRWSAANQQFEKQGPFDTLSLGLGYTSTPPQQSDPAQVVLDTILYQGSINELGPGTFRINYQNLKAGDYLLLGNPFPCAMDAAAFCAANPILDQVIYFWDHQSDTNAQGNNRSSDYSIWTPAGALSPNGGRTSNGKIAAGQAFMVRLHQKITQGSLLFESTMCREDQARGQFFKRQNDKSWKLSIEGADQQRASLLLVQRDQNFKGLDRLGDAILNSSSALRLASEVEGQLLSVDARPYFDKVSLTIDLPYSGSYCFRTEELSTEEMLYLVDHQSGQVRALEDSLCFSLGEGWLSNRFSCIWLPRSDLHLPENQHPDCWWDGHTLRSAERVKIQKLEIFDLGGNRKLEQFDLQLPWSGLALPRGVYLLNYQIDRQYYQTLIYNQT